jgi:hypothetical protein
MTSPIPPKVDSPSKNEVGASRNEPDTFASFGDYFVQYLLVAGTLSAVPFWVTTLKDFPLYASLRGILGAFTPLATFLLFGLGFFYRREISHALFFKKGAGLAQRRMKLVPTLLLALFALSASGYFATHLMSLRAARSDSYLDHLAYETVPDSLLPVLPAAATAQDSVAWARKVRRAVMRDFTNMDDAILAKAPASQVVYRYRLIGLYLGIFLSAYAALIFMALREFLVRGLGHKEGDLSKNAE